MMTAVDLFNTLEDLKEDEFKKFKWYLQQPNILEGYQSIKVSMLEDAERQDTVDVMVNTYHLHGALKVTKKVLEMINRNDLAQSLPDTSSGPEGHVLLHHSGIVYVMGHAPNKDGTEVSHSVAKTESSTHRVKREAAKTKPCKPILVQPLNTITNLKMSIV
uniref:Pyrin domain-containing protein n=1 Tax=Sander lucioperca TaxID=283035 RepID=A0A8D0A4M3_SANLU